MALAIGFHEPWRKRLPGEGETGGSTGKTALRWTVRRDKEKENGKRICARRCPGGRVSTAEALNGN